MDNARKSEGQGVSEISEGVSETVTKTATGAIEAALGQDDLDPSKVDNKDLVKEDLEKVQCFRRVVINIDHCSIINFLLKKSIICQKVDNLVDILSTIAKRLKKD